VNIVKRIFAAAAGGSWTSTTLDPAVSAAAIAPDGLTGEGVVNLSKTVFPVGGTSCLTTANILPYTITGNSDTADMKDVVLADFTDQVSVSSCGEVKVTKATDPAGKTGTFPYTLSRSDNSALNFDGDTSVTGSLTGDGDSNLITDLKAGTNYTLAEGALDPAWALQTISCTTDGTTDDVYPGAADFIVKVSTIADCTITNKLQEGTLTVIKHVVNDNGGGASASDFTIGLNDAGNTTFSGDEGGTQNTFVDGYGYDVTESGPSGYDATYVGDCTGSIEAGVDKTCTVTNDDVAPKLTVIKTVMNDNGGTAVASDFTLDSGGTNDSPDNFAV
jgi:hypothetical protein